MLTPRAHRGVVLLLFIAKPAVKTGITSGCPANDGESRNAHQFCIEGTKSQRRQCPQSPLLQQWCIDSK